jgi:hypothetical protein
MGVVVVVGTAKGAALLRAGAGRDAWSVEALLHKGWLVTAAARDAAGRTYLGVTSDVYGASILASDDLVSWRQLESAPRYAAGDPGNPGHNRILGATDPLGRFQAGGRHVDQIWRLCAAGDALYAGVSEAGLFRSDDRGKTWEPVRGLNDHPSRAGWVPGLGGLCAHSILVDRRRPERIWVGISAAGVFRSDDGGRSFAPKNDGIAPGEAFCVHCLAHDPDAADLIYRQDHRGMYRSRDGGDTWEPIENGLPPGELSEGRRCAFGFPVALDPRSRTVYSVPLEGDNFRFPHGGRLRVYRTRDGGERWEPLERGLPANCYANVLRGALAVDGLDPCGVYLGTTAGTVYASRDGGESWSTISCTLPKVLCVAAFEI